MDMERMKWIDGWRGVGCFIICLTHCLSEFYGIRMCLGKSGVCMLFMLTAYLYFEKYYYNSFAWSVKSYLNFCIKRIIRLMPLYIITIIIGIPIFDLTPKEVVLNVLLVKTIYHFWTLPIELIFYIIFPFLIIILKRVKDFFVPCILIMCILLCWGGVLQPYHKIR